jgi:hypothetical protein
MLHHLPVLGTQYPKAASLREICALPTCIRGDTGFKNERDALYTKYASGWLGAEFFHLC